MMNYPKEYLPMYNCDKKENFKSWINNKKVMIKMITGLHLFHVKHDLKRDNWPLIYM